MDEPAPKRRGGQPAKRTPERAEIILNALRTGCTRRAAAMMADTTAQSLARWMAANVTMRHSVLRAEAHAEVRATATVMDAAFGRPAQYDDLNRLIRPPVPADPKYATWWLERRRRADYGANVTVDIRQMAERVSREDGLDVEEVMAELDDLLSG